MHIGRSSMLPRAVRRSAGRATSLSVVMPTISFTGTFERCARRVVELLDSSRCEAEFVVVLDGERQVAPGWLCRRGVRVVCTGSIGGPAVARNFAATTAHGDILLFVDADVELWPGAIDLVHDRFAADPGLSGMFGTYDDQPGCEGTVSQFRNLLHHHTHSSHAGAASTFWSGCGAMRAGVFRDAGGFDGRFRYPSVEDVELGMRITADGGRIELDPGLRCKHLKEWTLASMIHTDVFRRAVPWTRMSLKVGRLPASLATDWSSRTCGIAAMSAVFLAALAVAAPGWMTVPAAIAAASCIAVLFALNFAFYDLCRRRRGVPFAAAACILHLLFFVYSSVTFGVVVVHALVADRLPKQECDEIALKPLVRSSADSLETA